MIWTGSLDASVLQNPQIKIPSQDQHMREPVVQRMGFDWSFIDLLDPFVVKTSYTARSMRAIALELSKAPYYPFDNPQRAQKVFQIMQILLESAYRGQDNCISHIRDQKRELKKVKKALKKQQKPTEVVGVQCPVCLKPFESIEYLDRHVHLKHKEQAATWKALRYPEEATSPPRSAPAETDVPLYLKQLQSQLQIEQQLSQQHVMNMINQRISNFESKIDELQNTMRREDRLAQTMPLDDSELDYSPMRRKPRARSQMRADYDRRRHRRPKEDDFELTIDYSDDYEYDFDDRYRRSRRRVKQKSAKTSPKLNLSVQEVGCAFEVSKESENRTETVAEEEKSPVTSPERKEEDLERLLSATSYVSSLVEQPGWESDEEVAKEEPIKEEETPKRRRRKHKTETVKEEAKTPTKEKHKKKHSTRKEGVVEKEERKKVVTRNPEEIAQLRDLVSLKPKRREETKTEKAETTSDHRSTPKRKEKHVKEAKSKVEKPEQQKVDEKIVPKESVVVEEMPKQQQTYHVSFVESQNVAIKEEGLPGDVADMKQEQARPVEDLPEEPSSPTNPDISVEEPEPEVVQEEMTVQNLPVEVVQEEAMPANPEPEVAQEKTADPPVEVAQEAKTEHSEPELLQEKTVDPPVEVAQEAKTEHSEPELLQEEEKAVDPPVEVAQEEAKTADPEPELVQEEAKTEDLPVEQREPEVHEVALGQYALVQEPEPEVVQEEVQHEELEDAFEEVVVSDPDYYYEEEEVIEIEESDDPVQQFHERNPLDDLLSGAEQQGDHAVISDFGVPREEIISDFDEPVQGDDEMSSNSFDKDDDPPRPRSRDSDIAYLLSDNHSDSIILVSETDHPPGDLMLPIIDESERQSDYVEVVSDVAAGGGSDRGLDLTDDEIGSSDLLAGVSDDDGGAIPLGGASYGVLTSNNNFSIPPEDPPKPKPSGFSVVSAMGMPRQRQDIPEISIPKQRSGWNTFDIPNNQRLPVFLEEDEL